jgi:hypothetical protein
MAGVKPGFIHGANARVKLDGKTLAYCTDLNYTIDMATVPIEAIGSYEVKAYEPIAYSVNGSFSVIRYTKHLVKGGSPTKGAKTGNPAVALGGDNKVGTQLNPGQVLSSSTFDMEIFQVNSVSESDTNAADDNSVFELKDCRVTRRSSSLNKRGVMVDSYTFVAILGGDKDVDTAAVVSASGSTIADLS